MDLWRQCGKIRLERIKNADIRKKMGIGIDIIQTTEVKILKLFRHVQIMPENTLPKKYLNGHC